MTRILQITDCHLLADPQARLLGVDTAASLCAVLSHALALTQPDLLLVTGDISHDGTVASYARFAELVRNVFAGQVLALPGNHDAGAALAQTLGAHHAILAVRGIAHLDLPNGRVIAIDSHQDDQAPAHLAPGVLVQLQELVETAAQPLLLALHHPLLPVGAPWLDKDRLQVVLPQGQSLLEWLGNRSLVRAVVFGHVHQAVAESYQHINLWGTPSTCFQFAPGSRRFTLDHQQPGYRWLTLDHLGHIHSQVERLRDYPLAIQQ